MAARAEPIFVVGALGGSTGIGAGARELGMRTAEALAVDPAEKDVKGQEDAEAAGQAPAHEAEETAAGLSMHQDDVANVMPSASVYAYIFFMSLTPEV